MSILLLLQNVLCILTTEKPRICPLESSNVVDGHYGDYQSFGVPIQDHGNNFLTFAAFVGGQKVLLIPDTGSFDLYLMSTEACRGGKTKPSPTHSLNGDMETRSGGDEDDGIREEVDVPNENPRSSQIPSLCELEYDPSKSPWFTPPNTKLINHRPIHFASGSLKSIAAFDAICVAGAEPLALDTDSKNALKLKEKTTSKHPDSESINGSRQLGTYQFYEIVKLSPDLRRIWTKFNGIFGLGYDGTVDKSARVIADETVSAIDRVERDIARSKENGGRVKISRILNQVTSGAANVGSGNRAIFGDRFAICLPKIAPITDEQSLRQNHSNIENKDESGNSDLSNERGGNLRGTPGGLEENGLSNQHGMLWSGSQIDRALYRDRGQDSPPPIANAGKRHWVVKVSDFFVDGEVFMEDEDRNCEKQVSQKISKLVRMMGMRRKQSTNVPASSSLENSWHKQGFLDTREHGPGVPISCSADANEFWGVGTPDGSVSAICQIRSLLRHKRNEAMERKASSSSLASINRHLAGPSKPPKICAAIVDSGTSLTALDLVSIARLTTRTKIAQLKSDCSNIDEMPTIYLTLFSDENGKNPTRQEIALPPAAYVTKIIPSDSFWKQFNSMRESVFLKIPIEYHHLLEEVEMSDLGDDLHSALIQFGGTRKKQRAQTGFNLKDKSPFCTPAFMFSPMGRSKVGYSGNGRGEYFDLDAGIDADMMILGIPLFRQYSIEFSRNVKDGEIVSGHMKFHKNDLWSGSCGHEESKDSLLQDVEKDGRFEPMTIRDLSSLRWPRLPE